MNKRIVTAGLCILFLVLTVVSVKGFELVTGYAISAGSFTISNSAPSLSVDNFTGDAGDLITLSYSASDPNGDNITISFGSPLNSSGQWQTNSSDTGVYSVMMNVSDGILEVNETTYIKLSPYCGDSSCDYVEIGETCSSCEVDCGVCPATPSSSSGGGGGGVSQSRVNELQAEIVRLSNLTENQGMFSVEIEELFLELQEDEFIGQQIKIENYAFESIILKAEVVGDLVNSIILDTSYLMISAGANKTLDLLILANKPAGIYKGIITLISSSTYQTIPITLKIIKRLAKLELETLDIDVDILTQEVMPGDILKFKLNMRKAPLITEDSEVVSMRYLLISLKSNYMNLITGAATTELINLSSRKKDILYEEEELSLENVLIVPKEITIPVDFPEGEYVLNVNAKFKGKQIPLFAKFVVKIPWYLQKVFGIQKGFLALFTILVSVLWMMFLISRVRVQTTRRYALKVDKGRLPKEGAYIGRVAERNKNAYIQLNDLKTHTLISGTTGCGKTIAAQVVIEEALNKGISVVVFDPTAQWTGFLKKCQSKGMLKKYSEFNMDNKKDPQNYDGKIYQINHPTKKCNLIGMMNDKLSIILLNKLDSRGLNNFISCAIKEVFKSNPKEHRKLRTLIVFDEVHRLLPRFGGSKKGYTALERSVREFRKWGIGVVLISQVTKDLVGPIEANISTQIQMKTNDREDLDRVKEKYGDDLLKAIVRSPTGTGLLSNTSYNNGRPYFVSFRPIKHSTKGLDIQELEERMKYNKLIAELKNKVKILESKRANIVYLKIELELAEKQITLGKFDIAKIYLDSVKHKLSRRMKGKKK